MDIVRGATRVATQTANATTAAAGAVSGAAINGIIGGVEGTVAGIRNGLSAGSHSTPAALITLGAIGATGLVEWPVVLAVGGTALLVRQLGGRNATPTQAEKTRSTDLAAAGPRASTTSSRRAAPTNSGRKAAKAPPRKTARTRTST